ncbi:lipid A biosynthesis acyltransferase [Polaromonas sp. A23]|uniref:LpxL/LpxP family acyltransferase n=1 Tax=Polaromonas sp. A23 TaxID=1944133 RepID=UPI000985C605|nr:lipid A biosynthesis acyltransferase [Polaromonas sp. A23]OOG41253.1 lipid A biosynthesis acyltransferase [Polaromonas sp. A23]
MSRFVTRAGIAFMQVLAIVPLSWTRALGAVLGWLLYVFVGSRRRVVQTNLQLCYPERSEAERRQLARQTFIHFAQAWLDRAWLWHAPRPWVQKRVRLIGAVNELAGNEATVIFLPHFVGLDAAWVGVALQMPRPSTTIYTDQSNKMVDRWILRGRRRFGNLRLFGRTDGVKPIVTALREGQPLYLLPDMDFGPEDSVFVPFYGLPTATVPSLSRFARLGRAKVVPLVPRLTPWGYDVEVLPAWESFPSSDMVADTAVMNDHLKAYIDTMPAQYYWVHKRFKTRPEGAPSFY